MYLSSCRTGLTGLSVPGEPAGLGGAQVLVNVLGFLVFGQPHRAEFAAVAGHAVAAPFGLRQVRVEVVDPDGPVAQPRGDAFDPARVLVPDARREPVRGVV